jgi:metal-responsive CopG/Arc/MetJ family transcriptional regulator
VPDDALTSIVAEMKIGRSDLIRFALREWLETNANLAVRQMDEESKMGGNA